MLVSEKSFLILLFYFCVLGVVNWMIYGWLPTFLKEHFVLDLGKAGLSATGYVQIGSFIGVILGGILADRWYQSNHRSRLYLIVIGFTLGAPFLFLMASTNIFGIAIIAMIIYGLARLMNASPAHSPPEEGCYFFSCVDFLFKGTQEGFAVFLIKK
jgi:sugar phosphate permease